MMKIGFSEFFGFPNQPQHSPAYNGVRHMMSIRIKFKWNKAAFNKILSNCHGKPIRTV